MSSVDRETGLVVTVVICGDVGGTEDGINELTAGVSIDVWSVSTNYEWEERR